MAEESTSQPPDIEISQIIAQPLKEDTIIGLANAKVLEDISNSMAETLFGDPELEHLAAALAFAQESQASDDMADDTRDDSTEDDAHPGSVETGTTAAL